jgi:hypothetical protein
MNTSKEINSSVANLIALELGKSFNASDKVYTLDNKQYEITWRIVGGFDKPETVRTINQMSPDSQKIHIICAENQTGDYDFYVMSFIDVCALATVKRPQHGGLTIERYNCSLANITQGQNKVENLKDGLDDAIRFQEKHPSLKTLIQYLESQRNIRAELNKQDMQMLKTLCL